MKNGKKSNGAAIAAGAVAIGVGGVTVAYAYSKFNDYKKNGGTKYTSFWAWALAGMPSTDSGTTYTVAPTITSSAISVPLNGTYSLSGAGCTPNGEVTVSSSPYSAPSTHTAAGDGSWTTGTFNASATTTVAGTFTFTVTDNTTGKASASPVSVTFTSTGTPPVDPQISASASSVTINGSSYSPASVTISGSGFTASGTVRLYSPGVLGTIDEILLGTTSSDTSGNISVTLSSSMYGTSPGTWSIYAVDGASSTSSNDVAISFTVVSTNAVISVSPSSLTSLNTSMTVSGTGFPWLTTVTLNMSLNGSVVWSGTVYSAAGSWSISNISPVSQGASSYNLQFVATYSGGQSNTLTVPVSVSSTPTYGTQSNPWVAVSSYQGAGYYENPGFAEVYISGSAQFSNWWNFGSPNPPVGSEGNPYLPGAGTGKFTWQSPGYYEIPSGWTYIPATGMTPGVAYYVNNEAFIVSVNSWL